jgi:hypothetical protein
VFGAYETNEVETPVRATINTAALYVWLLEQNNPHLYPRGLVVGFPLFREYQYSIVLTFDT